MGTSHELGQNFARVFDIAFSGASGGRELAWTTSWGSSTRMLGGLIMCHGDDNGMRVPPSVAPVQAYLMVVKEGDGVATTAAKLRDELRAAGVRAALDDRVDTAFGRRAVDAELKGYPVRVEIGPRDLAAGNVMLVRRLDGSKTPTPIGEVASDRTARLRRTPRASRCAA
jgi:prolyl-tRNA synthetase